MKTDLSHLPEHKQHELRQATNIICEMVSPEMVILFGSYARGDWVDERVPDDCYEYYQSDFDMLLVTKDQYQADKIERKTALADRLRRAIRTPISLIAEPINVVNHKLSRSHYFFIDISREGVLLHDSGKVRFEEPKELTAKERQRLAQEDFEYWFKSAKGFFGQYIHAFDDGENNLAAFLLHQATERLYNTILLVFTHYKPKTHDLAKLRAMVAGEEPAFLKVFPKSVEAEKRFELLRKAYVDARYKKTYTIMQEELEWLAERVRHLQQLTEQLCREKIASFTAPFDTAS